MSLRVGLVRVSLVRVGPVKTAAAWLLAAISLSGCGLTATPARPPRRTPLAVAQATHEYPAPRPPAQHVARGFTSPAAAIQAFATAYINWTADTVSAQMQVLAQVSVGQARSAVALAAAQTAGDYELARDGIANSGQIEAIAPLAGRSGQWLVVTRERTSASATTAYQGLQASWHVTLAKVEELAPGSWVISGWQPES